jgi:hypothetical protein
VPGLEPVQVAEGEGLDLAEQRLAQVAGDALPDLHREQVVGDGEGGAEDGDAEHDEGGLEDDGLIVRGDALVDDPFDQAGDGQVHDHHRGEEGQGGQRAAPVGADEAEEVANGVHGAYCWICASPMVAPGQGYAPGVSGGRSANDTAKVRS